MLRRYLRNKPTIYGSQVASTPYTKALMEMKPHVYLHMNDTVTKTPSTSFTYTYSLKGLLETTPIIGY